MYEKVANHALLTCSFICQFTVQYCDTVIAQHNSNKELAPQSVVTANIVSDHITLITSQANGWDVKFEEGNEVR